MTELPFRFIGHPLVDVGIATLCAATGVNNPQDLSVEAIEAFTRELAEIYLNPSMSGFLSYVVFANARFANPAQLKPAYDTKRREILNDLLNIWKPTFSASQYEKAASQDEHCIYSGDAAAVRVSRMYIPLTTDEKNINFVPQGVPMLPISGWCLLALLAMPLGGLASKGRMWIVHSYAPETTLYFAKQNLARNRRDFQIEGLSKRPNYKFARTHLMHDMSQAQRHNTRYPVTTYLFTSSGQKSEIEINHLTAPVLRFIDRARRETPQAWERIVQRAEHLNTQTENADGVVTYHQQNYFYEELFNLPNEAHAFLKRYILRMPRLGQPKGEGKNDPCYTYSPYTEASLISWPLATLFLTEVLEMDKDRIEAIKDIADQLAEHIVSQQDKRLFNGLFNARDEWSFRSMLVKTNKKAKIFSYDQFVQAFFTPIDDEKMRFDWSLPRDLMTIRIIEKLNQDSQNEILSSLIEDPQEEKTATETE